MENLLLAKTRHFKCSTFKSRVQQCPKYFFTLYNNSTSASKVIKQVCNSLISGKQRFYKFTFLPRWLKWVLCSSVRDRVWNFDLVPTWSCDKNQAQWTLGPKKKQQQKLITFPRYRDLWRKVEIQLCCCRQFKPLTLHDYK